MIYVFCFVHVAAFCKPGKTLKDFQKVEKAMLNFWCCHTVCLYQYVVCFRSSARIMAHLCYACALVSFIVTRDRAFETISTARQIVVRQSKETY